MSRTHSACQCRWRRRSSVAGVIRLADPRSGRHPAGSLQIDRAHATRNQAAPKQSLAKTALPQPYMFPDGAPLSVP